LTEEGRAHVAGYQDLLADIVNSLTSDLDEVERNQFSAVLAKMLSSPDQRDNPSSRSSSPGSGSRTAANEQ
ncbi:MAG: hypothetical protein AAGN46_17120, partial [Acidobacteriota bacterium]